MEEEQEISWNPALEKVLAKEGEKASGLAWLHTECEQYYGRLNTCIALPVVCLSAINGFISGSSSVIFGGDTNVSSLGVGAVSVGTALLSAVGSFFAWAKRTEAHRISSIQYLKLNKFINVELALARRERIRAKDMLKVVREQSERLLEISPAVPPHLKKLYNEKFHNDNDVSHPEITNGIQKIEIYNPPETPQHTNTIVHEIQLPNVAEESPAARRVKIGLDVN
jgi:hypothetical protein